jgi:type IV pilus assembly protein PilE
MKNIRINKRGFTLMEIIITIVILGVLAGLATPTYFKTIEQTRGNEALVNLGIVHMGEKLYRLNKGTYWDGGGATTIAAINTALDVDMSATYYTAVNVTAVGGTSYAATFTRNAVEGGAGTKWYRNDYTNGDAAPVKTEGGAF